MPWSFSAMNPKAVFSAWADPPARQAPTPSMPLNRIVIIANPHARTIRRSSLERAVGQGAGHFPVELVWTDHPGHARTLAAEHGQDPRTIVAVCGGDGTFFEALNGLPRTATAGLIPGGTANVIAKELGLPFSPLAAVQTLIAGATACLDTGRIDTAHPTNGPAPEPPLRFLMVAGFGLDAHIAARVPAFTKRLFGQYAYHLESALQYPFYRSPRIVVTDDQGRSYEGAFALFANLRRYGGNLFFAPEARADDGLLDLVLFRELTPLHLVGGFLAAHAGKGVPPRLAHRVRSRLFHLQSDVPVGLQLDGEVLPERRAATISVDPAALHMIIP
jgi:diacylglycerol kinase (ATP)